jgi:hypothetical protein
VRSSASGWIRDCAENWRWRSIRSSTGITFSGLLQRIALPINVGSVRYPGIKLHDTRIIRLLEVLLHNGSTVGGWTTRQIHEAVITTFQVSPKTYGLNQLRYDLRKLKGHGLLQRDGRRYAYRLTGKGVESRQGHQEHRQSAAGSLSHLTIIAVVLFIRI